jgi:hypothetical protein
MLTTKLACETQLTETTTHQQRAKHSNEKSEKTKKRFVSDGETFRAKKGTVESFLE